MGAKISKIFAMYLKCETRGTLDFTGFLNKKEVLFCTSKMRMVRIVVFLKSAVKSRVLATFPFPKNPNGGKMGADSNNFYSPNPFIIFFFQLVCDMQVYFSGDLAVFMPKPSGNFINA